MALFTKLKIQATVEALLLRADRKSGFEKAEADRLSLTFSGPAGDCHAGLTRKSDVRTLAFYPRNVDIRNVRQVTLVSTEELADIAQILGVPEIQPSWLGANLVTRGIPNLTMLPPSTRLQFPSGATLVVDMENKPCRQIADVIGQHFPEAQMHVVKASQQKRGVTAWVEREGDVVVGDTIGAWIPPQRLYTFAA